MGHVGVVLYVYMASALEFQILPLYRWIPWHHLHYCNWRAKGHVIWILTNQQAAW